MIKTKCKFYYGHTVDTTNLYVDFNEGAGQLTAILKVGEYSLTDFANEVTRAMNEAGLNVYTNSINRTSRLITITSAGTTFKFLPVSGTHAGQSAFTLLGFSVDGAYALTQTSTFASGSVWTPQFYPQEFVDFTQSQKVIPCLDP